jgi:hypothetical protein
MPVAAFDTLKYAKQLKQAGISEEHAEAQTAALAEALQAGLQELASKHDVDQARQEIKNLEARLDGQLTLLKWMLGATFAGVIGIIVRLFFLRVV